MKTVKNFDELITFIREFDLNQKQINEVINNTIHSFYLKDFNSKDELIESLIIFWEKWKDIKERPIFIDYDLDEIE
jgi:sulfatase maturation enzyme AslB (radical SAM superfamily)